MPIRKWKELVDKARAKQLQHQEYSTEAESEKESKLKNIMQRLIGCFCEHHVSWRQLISTAAEFDVLISIAIASDLYEGPTCRPLIVDPSVEDEAPFLAAKNLGHPVLRNDSLGDATVVPNDICIGGSNHARFTLLIGTNMGGKSTLLRQVCLAVILAQVGADVPAESFKMSLVDRIFVDFFKYLFIANCGSIF